MPKQESAFVAAVAAQFGLLQSDHGFARVEVCETFVSYESGSMKLGINLYRGRHSLEVGLEIVDLEDPAHGTYGISNAIRLCDPTEAEAFRLHSAHSDAEVSTEVERMRQLFDRYVLPRFDDPLLFLRDLGLQRRERAVVFAQRQADAANRRSVQEARAAGNWAAVAASLKAIHHRTQVEEAMLHLAKRKAGS